jgi:nitroreductase
LVEAARWAPSPFNVQPWELLFVTDDDIKRRLGRLTREAIVEQFKDADFLESVASWTRVTEAEWERRGDGILLGDQLPDTSLVRAVAPFLMKRARGVAFLGRLGAGNGPGQSTEKAMVASPALLVVLRNHDRQSPGASGDRWVAMSFGAMIQNLLLAATERNIGAQFVNAALEAPADRERVRLALNAPERCEPLLLLRLGYLEPAERVSVRLPAEQIVHYERYGGDS